MQRTGPIVQRVVIASCLALGIACSGTTKYAVRGTSRANGAGGTVQIEPIEGTNRLVTVSMERLPPPSQLGRGLAAYVVWFQSQNGELTKAGALAYDEGSRTGNLMATTTSREFRVKVTAEADDSVAAPGDVLITEQKVSVD